VACGQDFSLIFRLTRIGCRMFWSIETSVLCDNLSMEATRENADSASSPTHLQLIGGGGKPRETNK
jgi:hypothetical protein